MVFNINISVAGAPNGPNINVQVEAPDFGTALELAKEPVLKSAEASARTLVAALPASTAAAIKPEN